MRSLLDALWPAFPASEAKPSLRGLRKAMPAALGVLVAFFLFSGAPCAFAAGSPVWSITSVHSPTNIAPGSTARYLLVVSNVGTAPSDGAMTVTDSLPPGVIAASIESTFSGGWSCTLATLTLTCTSTEAVQPGFFSEEISVEISVANTVVEGEKLVNKATVSGGGAVACGGLGQPACASASEEATVSSSPASFGVQSVTGSLIAADGAPYTQAGGHPYEANVTFQYNSII